MGGKERNGFEGNTWKRCASATEVKDSNTKNEGRKRKTRTHVSKQPLAHDQQVGSGVRFGSESSLGKGWQKIAPCWLPVGFFGLSKNIHTSKSREFPILTF